ncbi:MAG: hypothetical protein J6J78_01720 [Clostridia bacterium]|nr:hypothetical protein [Clostridia bacterium]MBP3651773.1 hypothetical protein [Clostridia bacterium]
MKKDEDRKMKQSRVISFLAEECAGFHERPFFIAKNTPARNKLSIAGVLL